MARPQIIANGGSPGVKASVSAGSVVTLTLDSTVGVRSVQWRVFSTDETQTTASYPLATSGALGETATFNALGAGTAVVVAVQVNNGLVRGVAVPAETTNTIKVFVPTVDGFEVGAAGETYESDAVFGTTGILNAPVRALATFTASIDGVPAKLARVSSNANLALSGTPAAVDTDGVSVNPGDVVLVLAQTAPAENGLYVAAAGAWTRATNADTDAELRGMVVHVVDGTTRAGYVYQCTNAPSITVGTTAITFARMPDRFDRADLAAASSTPGSSILARFGASSELTADFFRTSDAAPALSGLVRAASRTTGLAFKNDAGTGDVEAISHDAGDIVRVGADSAEAIDLSVKSAGEICFIDNLVAFLRARTSGLLFGRDATLSLTQENASGGAGSTATIRAQNGDAGFDGGDLVLGVGDLGAGGAPGNLILDVEDNGADAGSLVLRAGAHGDVLSATYDGAAFDVRLVAKAGDAIRLEGEHVAAYSQDEVFARVVPGLDAAVVSGETLYAHDRAASRIATADATPTTALTYALPTASIGNFRAYVMGYATVAGTRARWIIEGAAGRVAAAAASLVGTNDTNAKKALSAAAWDATVTASGNNIIITVTGDAGVAIQWFVVLDVTLMAQAPS